MKMLQSRTLLWVKRKNEKCLFLMGTWELRVYFYSGHFVFYCLKRYYGLLKAGHPIIVAIGTINLKWPHVSSMCRLFRIPSY